MPRRGAGSEVEATLFTPSSQFTQLAKEISESWNFDTVVQPSASTMGRMGERSHVSGPPPPQRHASASRVPDKDRLIEKLMRDNEELTSTVNELDGRLRAALRERDELEAELAKGESERITGAVGKQLLASIQEQSALARREREEGSRSHEFLEGIFRELEKQLVAARAERDEIMSRHDRERRAARVKTKEVEERSASAAAARCAQSAVSYTHLTLPTKA